MTPRAQTRTPVPADAAPVGASAALVPVVPPGERDENGIRHNADPVSAAIIALQPGAYVRLDLGDVIKYAAPLPPGEILWISYPAGQPVVVIEDPEQGDRPDTRPTEGDAAVNERVAREYPHMRPVLGPTNVCVYEGAPAVTVRTGQAGNRFGLCAECAPGHDISVVAGRVAARQAAERIDRQLAACADGQPPRVVELYDCMREIVREADDPQAALDWIAGRLAADMKARGVSA